MSPSIKFEISPTESLMDQFEGSSPNDYPSLFDGINPSEIDGSEYDYADYERFDPLTGNDSGIATSTTSGTPQPQPEKKVVKKRKSWGQQLPEPKTNLPPRKRAKTEDEKEQRRVERVLRNRRAAQSSRERKRQEVEALESEKVAIERRNRDLELRLAEAEARNLALEQQLMRLSSSSAASSPYLSSPGKSAEAVSSSPRQVTFSQPLFPSSDSSAPFQQPQTVNPASLSPEIRPVSETGSENSNARAPDVTQHSAVSVGDATALDASHAPPQLDLSHYYSYPHASSSHDFLDDILPVADSFALDLAHLDAPHAGAGGDPFADFRLDDFLVASHDAFDAPFPLEERGSATTAGLQPPFGASSDGCDDGRNAVAV